MNKVSSNDYCSTPVERVKILCMLMTLRAPDANDITQLSTIPDTPVNEGTSAPQLQDGNTDANTDKMKSHMNERHSGCEMPFQKL